MERLLARVPNGDRDTVLRVGLYYAALHCWNIIVDAWPDGEMFHQVSSFFALKFQRRP
jgi:hypothetical protein